MRFFANSNLEIPVRWYRAQAGAKVFPGLNRFALGYWDMDRLEYLGIGQTAPAALAYDKGMTIPTSHGQHFCGNILDYRDGMIYPPPGPPVFYDEWGTPVCCPGAGPPVPNPPPPPPEDDVRDINYWKHVSGAIESWHPATVCNWQFTSPAAGTGKDQDYLTPYFPSRGGVIDRIGVYLGQLPPQLCLARIAIYEAKSETDLTPGNLVLETPELDLFNTTAGQFVFHSVNFAFNHLKLYWMGLNLSEFNNLGLGAVFTQDGPPIFGTSENWEMRNSMIRPRSYGPFPNPYPDIVNSDFVDGTPGYVFVRYVS